MAKLVNGRSTVVDLSRWTNAGVLAELKAIICCYRLRRDLPSNRNEAGWVIGRELWMMGYMAFIDEWCLLIVSALFSGNGWNMSEPRIAKISSIWRYRRSILARLVGIVWSVVHFAAGRSILNVPQKIFDLLSVSIPPIISPVDSELLHILLRLSTIILRALVMPKPGMYN